jgi:hypothetical protein
MRRICLTLFLAAAVVAGCGSSNATSGVPSGGGGGGGGGNVHASVTFKGQTYNISGGMCTQAGPLGWEVRVGAYEETTTNVDYLIVIVSSQSLSSAAGRAGGVYWVLAAGKQTGTIGADLSGSFSGTDTISGKQVSGTFACS